MSIVTSQQLARYLEQYRNIEVTFNRQVIEATGLLTRNVFLKVLDQQWPCIVYSSSLAGAKVIAGVKTAFFDAVRQANGHVAMRCSFKLPEKAEPISFFVTSHASGFTPYNPQNPDVQIISLEFTQRPPDDLILILGTLLEANANSLRRKEERIVLTPESLKKLGLDSRDAILTAEGTRRRCVLRDLSFSGARVLVGGEAPLPVSAPVDLRIAKGEQLEEMTIAGTVMRADEVEGRKDIQILGIRFSSDPPMSYKLMINSYLIGQRKTPQKPPAAPPPPRTVPTPQTPPKG